MNNRLAVSHPRATEFRRNEYDVTNSVDTTDAADVAAAVRRIFEDLYQVDDDGSIGRACTDLATLYRGQRPGYHACDTEYHDVQHVLDVSLAMARLMDGYVRAHDASVLDPDLFRFGMLTALYHDCGYIRSRRDTRHRHGAEYTRTHVSRGGRFLREYLHEIGMHEFAEAAPPTMHYTGYEVPVDRIRAEPRFRLIGGLLGTADILAQMADRCYLEKCYERLYPEFVRGGIARTADPAGGEKILFESAADLIYKTPGFFKGATRRLNDDLGGYYRYLGQHFGGANLYFDELEKNIRYAGTIAERRDIGLLRRRPPETIAA